MQKLLEILEKQGRGLVFLSGPSNCGKTQLIKALEKRRGETVVLTGEQLIGELAQQLRTAGQPKLTPPACSCLCIEDLDWYGGREQTEYVLAELLSGWAQKQLVIVTGIQLRNRMGYLFSRLEEFAYYEKNETFGQWLAV